MGKRPKPTSMASSRLRPKARSGWIHGVEQLLRVVRSRPRARPDGLLCPGWDDLVVDAWLLGAAVTTWVAPRAGGRGLRARAGRCLTPGGGGWGVGVWLHVFNTPQSGSSAASTPPPATIVPLSGPTTVNRRRHRRPEPDEELMNGGRPLSCRMQAPSAREPRQPCHSPARRRATRSSVGGWVVNHLANWTRRPVRGFTMYFWAWAGCTSMGMRRAPCSSLSSARASGSPLPMSAHRCGRPRTRGCG